MHAIVIIIYIALVAAAILWAWAVYDALWRLVQSGKRAELLGHAIVDAVRNTRQELADYRGAFDTLAPHVIGIRATLESVVRVEKPQSSIEPQLQNLTESITILKSAIETMHADPQDIHAQFSGITESVEMLRSAIHTRAAEPPRVHALEAPQVPTPHGEAKTLLLMNKDHTTAHEVTWHRDVPSVYSYGGRVFELLGPNDAGQWEFLPC